VHHAAPVLDELSEDLLVAVAKRVQERIIITFES
jgi:hypothetical protein